jgi:hypothetical protein
MNDCCAAAAACAFVMSIADGEFSSSESFKIVIESISSKSEPSIHSTLRGRAIEWNDECASANDLMRLNDDHSNEIDSRDSQFEQHSEKEF